MLQSSQTFNSGHFLSLASFTIAVLLRCFCRSVNVNVFHFICIWPSCGILISWPGLRPMSLWWKHGFLITGPPENSQMLSFERRFIEDSGQYRFLITKISLPSRGRGNHGPFKDLPQGYCTAHYASWMIPQDPSLFPFPTPVKRAHHVADTMLTCGDLPLH